MRWLGHVKRMEDTRLPKQVLYGELSQGKRCTGRPKLRYKDICKRTLKELCIKEEEWSQMAEDRDKWRSEVFDGATSYENNRIKDVEESRQRRKNTTSDETHNTMLNCKFCRRSCKSRAGLASHERHCSRKS